MKLKWTVDCKIFKKHRYSFYDDRCIVCGRLNSTKHSRRPKKAV